MSCVFNYVKNLIKPIRKGHSRTWENMVDDMGSLKKKWLVCIISLQGRYKNSDRLRKGELRSDLKKNRPSNYWLLMKRNEIKKC